MDKEMSDKDQTNRRINTFLVAVDFSHCSVFALRTAISIMGQRPGRIVVLHVIDRDFIEKCINHDLGTEDHIKKTLFLHARAKLKNLLQEEGMDEAGVEKIICDGIPFIEINKKAIQSDADMIVMGNRGNSGDLKTIFFGSTAERVLRFTKRPVLCVPMEEENNQKNHKQE